MIVKTNNYPHLLVNHLFLSVFVFLFVVLIFLVFLFRLCTVGSGGGMTIISGIYGIGTNWKIFIERISTK